MGMPGACHHDHPPAQPQPQMPLAGGSTGEEMQRHALFGGAIQADFPPRFEDVSNFRDVPNNQEVFADASRDESIVVELLEMKADVADADSSRWFLEDLMREQEAQAGSTVSKGRQGAEALNVVRVYLANIRLRNVHTDVLITVNEPLFISDRSESAAAAGAAGVTQAAVQEASAGVLGATAGGQVFQRLLSSFQVNDWGLFGHQ
ncbi:hypothetical protein CLOM_g12584 [Closterium sp. NIES-68]|nr:hypothetical protein CLOM_g4956 [Closterium sp. NIES-68]GJP53432.1 hypothetical protein CLOM_g12584 [Closterium sp. NIES-68]GJP79992.1 hypothetical protein CLOP_g10216 [Closterium sp. NIES-67]GJP85456.1 hypothetical protein CLOP_g15557 [Closterium sp. NIES-67]